MSNFKISEIDIENKLCTGHESIHLEKIIQDLPIGYTKI